MSEVKDYTPGKVANSNTKVGLWDWLKPTAIVVGVAGAATVAMYAVAGQAIAENTEATFTSITADAKRTFIPRNVSREFYIPN